METDLRLINDLHQHILTDPRAVQPFRLLTQIYSKHGMTVEATQTARNILEIDRYGLDQETLDALGPKVLQTLKQTLNTRRPRSLECQPSNAHSSTSLGHAQRSYIAPSPPQYTRHQNPSPQPPPIQRVADRMAADPRNSLTTAINDLAALVQLTRQQMPTPSSDEVRSACVARTNALASVLHPRYTYLAHQAFMHTTHELLAHAYANDATMIAMDPISSIPRAHFFASEDNYAWDMAELAAALAANPAAALRNPLSRAPFTEADITAIVHHPLGRRLAAIQVSQRELRRGVRGETIRRLKDLAGVMLQDEDSMEVSREAMDDFALYVAALPQYEKEALVTLRVPATDQHTGVGYDASVGDMLKDAKANQVCGHKAGDFLSQAVDYLERPRGW